MASMPVPDDLLQMFARSPDAKGCTISFDAHSINVFKGGKSRMLARPCSMPDVQAAVRDVSK